MKQKKMETQVLFKDFVKGLWKHNPVFRLILGMCPTLAVTNVAVNGLAMGLATSFVLIFSGIVISSIKNFIPSKVRIPCYIVVVASFVTIADLFMAAYYPPIHAVLSIYVPLIVVNCIILGRMEAFAGKMPLPRAFSDAFGMSLGFTWALIFLASVREFLGFGSVFGFQLLGSWYPGVLLMKLPGGAFITLGLLIGLMNIISRKKHV